MLDGSLEKSCTCTNFFLTGLNNVLDGIVWTWWNQHCLTRTVHSQNNIRAKHFRKISETCDMFWSSFYKCRTVDHWIIQSLSWTCAYAYRRSYGIFRWSWITMTSPALHWHNSLIVQRLTHSLTHYTTRPTTGFWCGSLHRDNATQIQVFFCAVQKRAQIAAWSYSDWGDC